MLVVTVTLGVMIVITVIGNILVCLSVVLVKKLRHPSNYLLVSLAISDLCVSILVMPLALYQEVHPHWSLGQTVCNMWVSFDVTCCTASILNLCTISVDRYLSITRPLTYGVNASAHRSFCFIASIWVASCLISVPPLLLFGNEHGTEEAPECQVSQNIIYQLYATLGAFYIPLLVMIVLYYKIYAAAKKVVEAELRAQPAKSKPSSSPAMKKLIPSTRTSTQGENLQNQLVMRPKVDENGEEEMELPGENLRVPSNMRKEKRVTPATPRPVMVVRAQDELRTSSALRERKASITLGVIMTAFTVCWLPFFILAVLRPFSHSVYNIPRWIVSFALWLGYANSMLNPIIYVTFHQDFRQAFKYLLCCQCGTMSTRMREEAYQCQFG